MPIGFHGTSLNKARSNLFVVCCPVWKLIMSVLHFCYRLKVICSALGFARHVPVGLTGLAAAGEVKELEMEPEGDTQLLVLWLNQGIREGRL